MLMKLTLHSFNVGADGARGDETHAKVHALQHRGADGQRQHHEDSRLRQRGQHGYQHL